MPKVIKLDEEGKPVGAHQTRSQPEVQVEVIPWTPWLRTQEQRHAIANAKSVIVTGIGILNAAFRDQPVAIVRKAGKHQVKASGFLGKGSLVLPLMFKKENCMTSALDKCAVRHPHAVNVVVTWPVSEAEKLAGDENESHEIEIVVQPDFKLPRGGGEKDAELKWSTMDSAYLFWGIRRQEKEDDEWNCEIVRQDVMVIVAFTPAATLTKCGGPSGAGGTQTYTASVPVIINTKQIVADTEVVLKWQQVRKPEEKKKKKKKNEGTWVDNLAATESKRIKRAGKAEVI